MRFSLIVSTRDSKAGLPWHRGQQGSEVELILIDNPGRVGLAKALNEGLDVAQGEFCCFLHDDVAIEGKRWLDDLAELVSAGFDLVGVAGSRQMLPSGAWWTAPTDQLRGVVWHKDESGGIEQSHYGAADDPVLGASEVVSLDGVLLFGRRELFAQVPFDPEFFDGYHFYDSDLCLRWLLWHGRRLGVCHRFKVIHDKGASLENWSGFHGRFLERFGGFLPLAHASVACWRRNVRALEQTSPDFLRGLHGGRPAGSIKEFQLDEGKLFARRGLEKIIIDDPPIESATNSAIRLFGAGSGTLIDELTLDPGRSVEVIEPEAHLWLRHLSQRDWSDALASGRLRPTAPIADHPELAEISLLEHVGKEAGRSNEFHDAIELRSGSFELNRAFFEAISSAPQAARDAARRLSNIIRKEIAFDVAVVSPSCALFDDLAQCFSRLGLRTHLARVPDRASAWSRSRWIAQVRHIIERPALMTVLRNRTMVESGDPRECCRLERFLPGKVVSYWWDRPNVASRIDWENPSSRGDSFAIAHSLVDSVAGLCQWLPPASRSAFTDVADDEALGSKRDLELTFVGQSRYETLTPHLQTLTTILSRDAGRLGRSLADEINLSKGFASLVRTLSRFEPEVKEVLRRYSESFRHHAYYLVYRWDMAWSSAWRLAAMETLAPLRPVAFGDDGWLNAGVVPRERFGGVLPTEQTPDLYRRSRLNLNVNFMQSGSTVNPKVLDICGVGGLALTDDRPELASLFPDPDSRPAVFQCLEELLDVASDLLRKDDIDRRRRAMEQVRGSHRMIHRASTLATWGELGDRVDETAINLL